MYKLREKKRALESDIKAIEVERLTIEVALMVQMDAEGVEKSTGKAASVSIAKSIKPSVENWDLFYGYIHRKKLYHLLERRPSVTGCRELFEKRGKIPGVVPFEQRQINMRNL